MLALLLAAAAPQTALDAERAFAAAAQRDGQWTAFRRFAAPDAMMNPPDWVKAQAWLKDRRDPAAAVHWQPIASYISCDGGTTVNTGAWQRPDGSGGYFTTVWRRQADGGWKWRIDFGDVLAAPRAVPRAPLIRKAACPAKPIALRRMGYRFGGSGDGGSADGSLQYHWWQPGFTFGVEMWTGTAFETVIDDRIPPAPAP